VRAFFRNEKNLLWANTSSGAKKIAPSGAAFYILGQAAMPEYVLFTYWLAGGGLMAYFSCSSSSTILS